MASRENFPPATPSRRKIRSQSCPPAIDVIQVHISIPIPQQRLRNSSRSIGEEEEVTEDQSFSEEASINTEFNSENSLNDSQASNSSMQISDDSDVEITGVEIKKLTKKDRKIIKMQKKINKKKRKIKKLIGNKKKEVVEKMSTPIPIDKDSDRESRNSDLIEIIDLTDSIISVSSNDSFDDELTVPTARKRAQSDPIFSVSEDELKIHKRAKTRSQSTENNEPTIKHGAKTPFTLKVTTVKTEKETSEVTGQVIASSETEEVNPSLFVIPEEITEESQTESVFDISTKFGPDGSFEGRILKFRGEEGPGILLVGDQSIDLHSFLNKVKELHEQQRRIVNYPAPALQESTENDPDDTPGISGVPIQQQPGWSGQVPADDDDSVDTPETSGVPIQQQLGWAGQINDDDNDSVDTPETSGVPIQQQPGWSSQERTYNVPVATPGTSGVPIQQQPGWAGQVITCDDDDSVDTPETSDVPIQRQPGWSG